MTKKPIERAFQGRPQDDDFALAVERLNVTANAHLYRQGSGTVVNYDPALYTSTTGFLSRSCEHEMGNEVEVEDGRIVGACVRCGDAIMGRRMVGGLGLARLRSALVNALGDSGAMVDLADELERVEMMLEVEEQSLGEARKLIETSRKMIMVIMGDQGE